MIQNIQILFYGEKSIRLISITNNIWAKYNVLMEYIEVKTILSFAGIKTLYLNCRYKSSNWINCSNSIVYCGQALCHGNFNTASAWILLLQSANTFDTQPLFYISVCVCIIMYGLSVYENGWIWMILQCSYNRDHCNETSNILNAFIFSNNYFYEYIWVPQKYGVYNGWHVYCNKKWAKINIFVYINIVIYTFYI